MKIFTRAAGLAVLGMMAIAGAAPAKAALPPAAYAGDAADKTYKPMRCVGAYAVWPKFTGWGDGPAGTYVWWNPATGSCEKGGSAAGPQF